MSFSVSATTKAGSLIREGWRRRQDFTYWYMIFELHGKMGKYTSDE